MPTTQYGPGDEPIPGSGYRIVSFLGRGGFGEVWKARAPGGSEAALKIIRLGSLEGRKEFRALQLVKRVRHPNLIPIFGFWLKSADGQILDDAAIDSSEVARHTQASAKTMVVPSSPAPDAAEELFIAMGLGDKSLFDRLEECRKEDMPGIPREELLGYLEDSAEAIDFLNRPVHEPGLGRPAIQHCDIKPHNLMIVGGAVQVCDFGLARMMGANRATTAAGSIAYSAPESLIENEPSFSTDQYSLAITYYELRNGKLPYQNDSFAAILDAKRSANLDFADLPDAERAVLKRATLRNPDDRYGSCREMVAALRNAVSAEARGDGSGRRRWSLAPVAAFLVLMFATVGGWFAWLRPWPFDRFMTPAAHLDPNRAAAPAGDIPKVIPRGEVPDAKRVVKANTDKGSSGVKPVLSAGGKNSDQVASKGKSIEAPAKESMAAGHFRHGCELLDAKKYDEAIEEFQQTILLAPDDTAKWPKYGEAYLARGTQALSKQDFVVAVPDLEQAAKFLPKEAKVFSRLAAAWVGQQRWDRAVANYTTAIEIEHHPLDYEARGQAYRSLHDLDKAIADFHRSVELDPKNARAYAELGDAYLDKDDPQSAVRELSHAIDLYHGDPNSNFREFSARHLRAYAYIKLGKNDEAAADLERVFALAQSDQDRSSSHELFYLLSVRLSEAKRYPDALRWVTRAIETAPDDATRKTYREHAKVYSDEISRTSPPPQSP